MSRIHTSEVEKVKAEEQRRLDEQFNLDKERYGDMLNETRSRRRRVMLSDGYYLADFIEAFDIEEKKDNYVRQGLRITFDVTDLESLEKPIRITTTYWNGGIDYFYDMLLNQMRWEYKFKVQGYFEDADILRFAKDKKIFLKKTTNGIYENWNVLPSSAELNPKGQTMFEDGTRVTKIIL